MILASHQPNFFPYMGYFYKIAKSDLFVFSDDVKFSNSKTGDMHNYNYIKGPNGKQKITMPVSRPSNALMSDVRVCYDEKQIRGILVAVKQYYGKAPFFDEVYEDFRFAFEALFDLHDIRLVDFNRLAITRFCRKFGIETEMKWSPGFSVKKNARLVEMCKHFGADAYLCGSGAADYIDEAEFEAAGIKLVRSGYAPPVYPQRYGDFVPNLSVLDWIFNMGYALPEGWLK